MIAILSWYLLISLLGWLTFPLAYYLFPALADRGYTLARAAGLLIWGFLFWWMASLGLARNDLSGLLFALILSAGLSVWAWLHRRREIADWLKVNLRLVISAELIFLFAFLFMAYVRAANPDIVGTEKPMELAFINAILRSPTFPPHDPWLSGFAISYYYFGYVLTAMLARMTAVPGTTAFNLMLALIFALAALGAYGILYNLLAAFFPRKNGRTASRSLPVLGPLFLLIVSNLEGFLEVLHQRGLFWHFTAAGAASSSFWTWLDLQELSQPPSLPLHWIPDRYWWWWRASRIVQDYTLQHNFQEIIDEFPFFSFLLGDLHPHILSIPFVLLAVSVALNLFLGGWRGELHLPGVHLEISAPGFIFAALVIGGLAFLNVWDILVGAALVVFAYILFRVRGGGWKWSRLEELFSFGLPLIFAALLLYLPFYIGFSSQAGGLLPNLVNPTRGSALWIMFAPLWIPIFAFLIYLLTSVRGRWRPALILTVSLPLVLWILSWLLGIAIQFVNPDAAQQFLAAEGVTSLAALFNAALTRRLAAIGGLLSLLALLAFALSYFFSEHSEDSRAGEPDEFRDSASFDFKPIPFVALMIALGALLVIGPDFLYLRDLFGYRINTVFKFYYEAWILWSLAAAFGAAVLLRSLRGTWSWLFRIAMFILLFVSLTYPALSLPNKTNGFSPINGFTLNDFDRVRRESPDEAAAMQWLNGASYGVVMEAVGGSYSGYARMSTYSGLPAVLGWAWHEAQWRGSFAPQGTRQDDIKTLYTTTDWPTAQAVLQKYNVRYVVVGDLERAAYPVHDEKFKANLAQVFQQGSVTIYAVQ